MYRHVVDPQFGAVLHQLMSRAGLSQRALAQRAHVSRSYLSEIAAGQAVPSPDIADALDAALDADGELSRLVLPAGPGVDLTPAGPPVTPATVDALDRVLRAQRHLDDVVGATTILPPTLAHVDTVTAMTVHATGPSRPGLVQIAGQFAQFAGWLHTSVGSYPQARSMFARALELAIEAGDADLTATVVSYQGHVAWLTGQVPQALGLALAALRDERVYPGQRAYDAFAAARAHAALGGLDDARRMLDVANRLAADCDRWAGPVPAWQYYRAPWYWSLERGLVWLHACRHDRGHAAAAVTELAAGIAAMPADLAGADWAGEYLTHLAAAHRHAGDLGQARAVLARARQVADATRSARLTALVDTQRRRLPTGR